MKRFAALALALALFRAPGVALADNYKGLSLEQRFDQYEETSVHGE